MLCEPIYSIRARQWACRPLDEFRHQRKPRFFGFTIQKRNQILPDFKIQNALMGIYDDETTTVYRKTIEAFRMEYHRLEGVIDEAESLGELDKIKARFPKSLAEKSTKAKTAASPETPKSRRAPGGKK